MQFRAAVFLITVFSKYIFGLLEHGLSWWIIPRFSDLKSEYRDDFVYLLFSSSINSCCVRTMLGLCLQCFPSFQQFPLLAPVACPSLHSQSPTLFYCNRMLLVSPLPHSIFLVFGEPFIMTLNQRKTLLSLRSLKIRDTLPLGFVAFTSLQSTFNM